MNGQRTQVLLASLWKKSRNRRQYTFLKFSSIVFTRNCRFSCENYRIVCGEIKRYTYYVLNVQDESE